MPKLKKCPKCGEQNLRDAWHRGRRLRQECGNWECGWKGKIRTPEKRKIEASKKIDANHFGGFRYEIFDRYGHILKSSRSYRSRKEAKAELLKELDHGKADSLAGSYTGVLWPSTVIVKGAIFR